jgi:hypothetical protein
VRVRFLDSHLPLTFSLFFTAIIVDEVSQVNLCGDCGRAGPNQQFTITSTDRQSLAPLAEERNDKLPSLFPSCGGT